MSKATPIDHVIQAKAMVAHTCEVCGNTIYPGEEYISRTWLRNEGYTRKAYHIHCDALNNAFDMSDERTKYRRGDCAKWLFDKYCKGCSERGQCEKHPTMCRTVTYGALPVTYYGAAISSQRTHRQKEERHDE